MNYQHFDIEVSQNSYKNNDVCGDMFHYEITEKFTTLILCDGKGHGITGNISAQMVLSIVKNLLSSGFSIRNAMEVLLDFYANTGVDGSHYSAITIARIFPDGMVNILSYSNPNPIFLSPNNVLVLAGRPIDTGSGIISESNCFIKNGEGILLMTDGVTNAGIGRTNQ